MDLNNEKVYALVDEIIQKLKERKATAVLRIYGGSAVSYYYHDRSLTKDVDALYDSDPAVEEVKQEICQEQPELDAEWLNEHVFDVMPKFPDDNPTIYYKNDNITVTVASREYLLAMKAMVTRKTFVDLTDAAVLFNQLGLHNWMDIDKLVTKFYGPSQADSQELWFEDIEDYALKLKKETGSEPDNSEVTLTKDRGSAYSAVANSTESEEEK
ncbi:MAG: hypothetical protein LBM13_03485 [Candidatus Ancillula sp.]|jgi:hypothetical protein|nr:hypothetical protein [Candidatus Ancillula sp.]